MAWLKQVVGLRKVAINRDDTLRLIALRELGDASKWTMLAQMNNLLPPYIVNDISQVTSTRVLVAGSLISIPGPTPPPTGVSDEDSVLGTDFQLVRGMLVGDGTGDIGTVSSYANLQQALEHRLRTRKRELIAHPAYGNRVFEVLGQGAGPVAEQLSAAWAESCIRSDPRVTDASNVTATLTGDTIAIAGNAIPTDGKVLPVGATVGA